MRGLSASCCNSHFAKLFQGRSSTETGQKPYLVMATLRMAGTETMPALPDSNFGTKLGGRPEVVKSAISALMAAVEVLAASGIVLEQVERPAEQQMTDNLASCKGIIAGGAVPGVTVESALYYGIYSRAL